MAIFVMYIVFTTALLPKASLVPHWNEGPMLNQSQWITDVIVGKCKAHSTSLVSLQTCWSLGVKMRMIKSLNQNVLMQCWNLDIEKLPENYYEILVVDLDCPDSSILLLKASELRKFTLRNKWVLFSFSLGNMTMNVIDSQVRDYYPWLNDLNIFPDSEVVLATNKESEMLTMYRVGKTSLLRSVDPGKDRSDLQRSKLVASTVLFQPKLFKGFTSGYMPDVDTWPKLHYPIVVYLAEQLNFNLELWAVDDYGWEQNESFTGLMGQLQRREIDFAATGFFMRSDRIRVVDFTAETYHIRTTILFRQPPLSSVSNIFVLPFSSDVWLCLLVFYAVVIFVFSIEMMASRHYGIGSPISSIMDIITLVLGSVCQQGSHLVPEKLSGRITLFLLSLTALFFFTSYAANIVALLQSPSTALRTITDLVESPLAVGIQDLNYNRVYFKESVNTPTRLLYEKKVMPLGKNAYFRPTEGIKKVRKDLFAFNVETNLGYKMISETFQETEKCALSEIQLFPMPMLSLPLTKRSGYRELFTRKVRWQRETGILNRNGKIWLPQKPKCEDGRGGTGFVSVGLKEFLPALKVLLFGMLLSFILLLLETVYYYRKRTILRRMLRNLFNKKWWCPTSRELQNAMLQTEWSLQCGRRNECRF